MSQYGTHPQYTVGWDDGYEEATAAFKPLCKAAFKVLSNWEKGDLAAAVRELDAALAHHRRPR